MDIADDVLLSSWWDILVVREAIHLQGLPRSEALMGPSWALVGWTLLGPPWALMGQALVGHGLAGIIWLFEKPSI